MYNHSGHSIDIMIYKLIIYIFHLIHIYKKIHIDTHLFFPKKSESIFLEYYISNTLIYMHITYDIDMRRDSGVFSFRHYIFYSYFIHFSEHIYIHIHIHTYTYMYYSKWTKINIYETKPLNIFLRRKFSFIILGIGDV